MHERHIVGWKRDIQVDGEHNLKPVTCDEYIAKLEELIRSGDADSAALEALQTALRIFK